MKKYKVIIKLITDYLQARFSESAKKELKEYVSKESIKSEDDSWKAFLYRDENGIYIPSIQIKNCLINAGKDLKFKKQRRSLQQWVISNIIIIPEKIYLNKKEPDKIITSYPKRKDGNRVVVHHPAINKETLIHFEMLILDEIEEKILKELIKIGGKIYGIGARRRDMFGRFELISFG